MNNDAHVFVVFVLKSFIWTAAFGICTYVLGRRIRERRGIRARWVFLSSGLIVGLGISWTLYGYLPGLLIAVIATILGVACGLGSSLYFTAETFDRLDHKLGRYKRQ